MSIDEYVEKSRQEQRERFGEIGMKKDCVYHEVKRGKDRCTLCTTKNERRGRYPCECAVCYFYRTE